MTGKVHGSDVTVTDGRGRGRADGWTGWRADGQMGGRADRQTGWRAGGRPGALTRRLPLNGAFQTVGTGDFMSCPFFHIQNHKNVNF